MSTDWVPSEDVKSLYAEKIASSGLTEGDAKELCFSHLSASEARAERIAFSADDKYVHLPCLKIPYFDPFTGKPLAAAPRWPGFFRARALRDPAPTPKKFGKYTQASGSGVCAYFPRVTPIDWKKILEDPSYWILITEGELKAAKACKEGFATIGLGGVQNFHSRFTGADLLPEIEKINWVQRETYLVYDSDILVNKWVALAARRLSEELYLRGTIPRLVVVPPSGGGKTGLDDFLISDGKEGLDKLLQGGEYVTAIRPLFEMNERYAALMEGDAEVADMVSGSKIKSTQLVYRSTKSVSERRIGPDGKTVHGSVNAAKVWLDWPLRLEARRLIFDPAQPPLRLVDNDEGSSDFNTWKGFRVAPVKGDVSPFIKLIDHLFNGASEEIRHWFLSWLAYPIKHPGTKLLTAVVLHGLVHGSGKTLVGETMRRIYGEAYTTIGQKELKADFNEWAAHRSFVLGDDITGFDRREIHDTIKTMITQTRVRVNIKNVSAYELDDHTNLLFTSNRPNSFYIDNDDRRLFVWEVPASAGKKDRAFYVDYLNWLDARGGAAALLHWFAEYDTKDFDPGAAALVTIAKTKMREESRSDLVNWVEDLKRDPDALLTLNGVPMEGDLFTTKQLKIAYAAHAGVRDDESGLSGKMAAALSAAGFEQVYDRKVVKPGGSVEPGRYYAIRNPARWVGAQLPEIHKHLNPDKTKTEPKRKKF